MQDHLWDCTTQATGSRVPVRLLTCCHWRKAMWPPKATVAGSAGPGASRLRERVAAATAISSASARFCCTSQDMLAAIQAVANAVEVENALCKWSQLLEQRFGSGNSSLEKPWAVFQWPNLSPISAPASCPITLLPLLPQSTNN